MAQYYYARDGQQFGPLELEQLQSMVAAGQLLPGDLVWTEGMAKWEPAGSISGLFGAGSAPAATSPPSIAPQYRSGILGYETPANCAPRNLRPVSYVLWATLAGLTFVSAVLAEGIAIASASRAATTGFGLPPAFVAAACITGLLMVGTLFYSLVILHRAWRVIPPAEARTSPGKAVGFLFIPFFNLYWIFQAYYGLAADYRRTVALEPHVPRLWPGLFLAQCILHLMGFFPMCAIMFFLPCAALFNFCAFVLHFATTFQMCRAVNDACRRQAAGP